MKKKYTRTLAAALAAIMIWNTCDWHPQALAGSSVEYIEEVKELSEEILHQEVPYGTKYKDLELPDKLKMRVWEENVSDEDEEEDEATPSELKKAKASPSEMEKEDQEASKASPSDADDTPSDGNWKEIKVRWVLDEIFSEKDKYDGKTPGVYVFDAELKNSRYELGSGFLPRIEVTVLPEEIALMALETYDLTEKGNLVINGENKDQYDGSTIIGTYHPTERDSSVEGGIVIDNVTVDLTIEDVEVGYDHAGWNLAGILLKGKAKLNLTIKGDNTLSGADQGAGIEVGENATLVITDESTGTLKATGGGYGAAGIGGKAGIAVSTGIESYKTGTIVIKGGDIQATGGRYNFRMDNYGGAGIGTGVYGIGGEIQILGGTIKAQGGEDTGAGIGGGDNGTVDSIQIGGKDGEEPQITALADKGAAIGSGYNIRYGLILPCGEIKILSGEIKASGNIGHGKIHPLEDNGQKGGSVSISEDVKLELSNGTVAPRENCTFGKKTFKMSVYDNQLSDGNYEVNVSVYKEDDQDRTEPVYETESTMKVTAFKGTIPDITEWLGYVGNMQVVVEMTDSESNFTRTGTVFFKKGEDQTFNMVLGTEGYQKSVDLTVYDGRLEDGKTYTLTIQVGDSSESTMQPDILKVQHKQASKYGIQAGTISWHSAWTGDVPVTVSIQEETEGGNIYTRAGTWNLQPKEETDLSFAIGEKMYPVRFLFYSEQAASSEHMILKAIKTDEQNRELNQKQGEFVFDGKIVKDPSKENSAAASAYLPAGNYRFEIETGILGLGDTEGKIVLTKETVKANENEGTDIIALNDIGVLAEELDLSNGDITFSDVAGRLDISYYQEREGVKKQTIIQGQPYDQVYTITTKGENTPYGVTINTTKNETLKLELKDMEIYSSGDTAAIQLNGNSRVQFNLKGNSIIEMPEKENGSAGISVPKNTQLTIDSTEQGSLSVTSASYGDCGAVIGGSPDQDAGTIIISGGTVKAVQKKSSSSPSNEAAAIGSSKDKSVEKIEILGGCVEATAVGAGAGIGTGGLVYAKARHKGNVIIQNGTVTATAAGNGAGIGSGSEQDNEGYTTKVEINGGIVTAIAKGRGASIGSGSGGSNSQTIINGGTISVNSKTGINIPSDIGTSYYQTRGEAKVIINGATFCKSGGQALKIQTKNSDSVDKGEPVNQAGNPVYFTIAALSGIYEENGAVVKNAKISTLSYNYGFKDVRTDSNGRIYMYLPAADSVKAIFSGVTYKGKVEADAATNVLERDLTSVDYVNELLKNDSQSVVEFAQSADAVSWMEIPVNSAASLTGILDSQPEDATEISLYVRKKADASGVASAATEIKIPARPPKPESITDVVISGNRIQMSGSIGSEYEYGIKDVETAGAAIKWQSEVEFKNLNWAHRYDLVTRMKATESQFASKPSEAKQVTTQDTLLIFGSGKVFTTSGTYGQPLSEIKVELASGYTVVNGNYRPVSGRWEWSENQDGTPSLSIYPEVGQTKSYRVEFKPDVNQELYVRTLSTSIVPDISPKKLTAALTSEVEKVYDGTSEVTINATVETGITGQTLTISGLKGRFEDAYVGENKTITVDTSNVTISGDTNTDPDNYQITFPAETTGTIRQAQASVTIDPNTWTGQKTYGDDSFPLTGVKVVGDGTLTYTSSDPSVLTVDAQGVATIKGVGSVTISIEVGNGKNYAAAITPATAQIEVVKADENKVQIEPVEGKVYGDAPFDLAVSGQKGSGAVTYSVPEENEVLELSGTDGKETRILGAGTVTVTAEIAGDAKYNGTIVTREITIGKADAPQITWAAAAAIEAGSPLSRSALTGGSTEYGSFSWKNPAQLAEAGTHSYEMLFTPNEWVERNYEIAPMTGLVELTATIPPTDDKNNTGNGGNNGNNSNNSSNNNNSNNSNSNRGNRGSSGGHSSSSRSTTSGTTRTDSVKGKVSSDKGILTGSNNRTVNDGQSHWMQDAQGWWLRFADGSYPRAGEYGIDSIAYAWEHINGNWWAFDENGYIKTGWLRDEDYGGWFYIDPEHGMQTGWVLIDGKWYYFHPTSDGMKGLMYAGRRTPDGYYADENGAWDGRDRQ